MAFLQKLLEQLIHGIGFVRAPIPDGAAAVGFILVYHKVLAILIDAEGPGFAEILPDEKAHAQQGHSPLGTVFLQFRNRFGKKNGAGRIRHKILVFRAALGAFPFVRPNHTAAEFAFSG